MRSRAPLILAISLIVIGVIGFVGALVVTTLSSPGGSGRRGGEARSVDAMFIEQMVPHHQDAIDMSELALTEAEHTEIRELARSIKQSQSSENAQMRDWYEGWFGTEVPDVGGGGMMGPMMGGRTDLDRLRNAEDFDKEFIEQMVPHHQMAIMMARMAGRRSNTTEIRQLTDSIIETQSREIQDMQRWYRDWYGY